MPFCTTVGARKDLIPKNVRITFCIRPAVFGWFSIIRTRLLFYGVIEKEKKTISRYRKTRAHTQTRLAPHNHHLKLKNKTNDFVTFHDQRYLVGFPCRLKHRYRLPFSVTMCKITLFIWSTICTKQQSSFVRFIICWHSGIRLRACKVKFIPRRQIGNIR